MGLTMGCGKRGIRVVLRFWLLLNDCSHLLTSEVRRKGKILEKESECPLGPDLSPIVFSLPQPFLQHRQEILIYNWAVMGEGGAFIAPSSTEHGWDNSGSGLTPLHHSLEPLGQALGPPGLGGWEMPTEVTSYAYCLPCKDISVFGSGSRQFPWFFLGNHDLPR